MLSTAQNDTRRILAPSPTLRQKHREATYLLFTNRRVLGNSACAFHWLGTNAGLIYLGVLKVVLLRRVGPGCLFWIAVSVVLSVILTILLNIPFLFAG